MTSIYDNAYIIYLTYYLAIIDLLAAYYMFFIKTFGIKKMVPLSLDGL